MTSPSTTDACTTAPAPTPLEQLQTTLNTSVANEQQHTKDLQKNQRESVQLKQLIAAISDNLAKFDSGWTTLKRAFDTVSNNQAEALKQLVKELPGQTEQLGNAMKAWESDPFKKLHMQLEASETNLTDKLSQTVGKSELIEKQANQRFQAMSMASLTKRVATAEARLKKANSVPTDSDQQRAEKFALLSLTAEDLQMIRIEDGSFETSEPFGLPANRVDYESRLVGFANALRKASEDVISAKLAKQIEVEMQKKLSDELLAARNGREARLVAAVQAAIPNTAKPAAAS